MRPYRCLSCGARPRVFRSPLYLDASLRVDRFRVFCPGCGRYSPPVVGSMFCSAKTAAIFLWNSGYVHRSELDEEGGDEL